MENVICNSIAFHLINRKNLIKIMEGIDKTDCRYGDVILYKCENCNTFWLYYHLEYESYSRSGRWFFGEIKKEDVENMTPENAIMALEKAEKAFCGGSYFNSSGEEFKMEKGLLRLFL